MTFSTFVVKTPTAWLPVAISLASILFIFVYVAIFGTAQASSADEGAAARIFQLGMLVQAGIIGFFAVKYLPRMTKVALQVLVLQLTAAILSIALITFFEL